MANSENTRIIKRYGNRKLYDTELSRYVTIEEVSNHIRDGVSVKIIDNKTGEDITSTTLAQIVLEAEKKSRSRSSSGILESIIKTGTLSEFVVSSTNSVKSGLEEAERWFGQLLDSNRTFWLETRKYFRKNKEEAKFDEFGKRMETYFRSTVEKMKYNSNRERIKNERELHTLRQKIVELEQKLKEHEEEKRRIKNE